MTAPLALFDGAFWRDPYPAYAALRAEAPAALMQTPDGPVWMISRRSDVRAALTDARFSKDWRWTLPFEARATAPTLPLPMMILMDPPGHTRLRRLVSRSFTLRRMEGLRPRVAQIAAALLDALPATGTVDIMASYAHPLPVHVICELLGVPAEDRHEFAGWSNTMVDDSGPEDTTAAAASLYGYLAALIDAKREQPDDALLSALLDVATENDAEDDQLSRDELVGMAMLLLIAGHETTVNLIGNGLLALLTHPEQLGLLRAEPDLLPSAVEEFLRFDSPVYNAPVRFAVEDVDVAGVTVPAGSVVMLALGSANRDGDSVDDPDSLRIDRDDPGHVAFGHGLHHCLGAQLARIEGQEAIGMLLDRRPELALALDPADLLRRRSTLVRGLKELPLALGAPADPTSHPVW